MATFVETFTHPNPGSGTPEDIANHTGDDGQGYVELAPSLVVTTGHKASADSSGGGPDPARARVDTPLSGHDGRCTWEIVWTTVSGSIVLPFLITDNDNLIELSISTTGLVRLRKRIAAVLTTIGTDSDYGNPVAGQRVKFKVEWEAGVVSVWWSIHDGSSFPAFNATADKIWPSDTDVANATGRYWGFGSGDTGGIASGVAFEGYTAEDLGGGTPVWEIRGTGDLAITRNGSAQAGATVRLFNQTTEAYVGKTTSDASGEWVFTDLTETDVYHAFIEYENGGTEYQTLSRPFLSPTLAA